MNGCSRSDSVNGNAGNNGLSGGIGNYAVSGGDGDDNVHGAAGNDIVAGNAGANTLTDGPDNDLFLCGPSGQDRITDFQPGQDLRFGTCILGPASAPTPTQPAAPNSDNNPISPLSLSLSLP
jgi:RTX calcium-binding nonapeptide repeat (4 copies)